ncbi:MAG: phage holin family protein [Leptospiraceae bacterium]|nr:phage holin family protein [Leptospiraceae bacterium]MCP5498636.1 phage holin family protein [Leptospiraceae bacterium]
MIGFVINIVLLALVIMFVFPALHKDMKIKGEFQNSLVVALVFFVLNAMIRYGLAILSLGLGVIFYYLTLGIAGIFINALVLLLVQKLMPDYLEVPGFGYAILGGALLSLTNVISGMIH